MSFKANHQFKCSINEVFIEIHRLIVLQHISVAFYEATVIILSHMSIALQQQIRALYI